MSTVLIIDDEPEFRKVLAELLGSHGWQVLEAEEGDIGIQLAKSHQPDVIICDLLMPRCNGFQVCQALRSDPALRQARIIMVSGRDFESDRQEVFRQGADAFLLKPVDPEQLLALMEDREKPATAGGEAPLVSKGQPSTVSNPHAPGWFRFWGVRGSIATPGPATVFYGGNTTCLEVRADGEIIVLDAGTGIRGLGRHLVDEFGDQSLSLTLLLTHTHWDHIQGLPFFTPVYRPQNRVRILGYEGARHGLDTALFRQMESTFFPVGLGDLPAHVQIDELKEMSFQIGAVRVEACFANHPGVCVGYRLHTSDGSLAFFPDNEPYQGRIKSRPPDQRVNEAALAFALEQDRKMISFLRGVDVLIMDSQYDCQEYLGHVGWGHGCVSEVVNLALQAEVKHLFLFHHDPDHDDAKVTEMAEYARNLVKQAGGSLEVSGAREGQQLTFQEIRKPGRMGNAAA
jgi:CheY-like chemotaxis protein/phosphoribosyl 1,2-cyclic phosphodiesterase